MKKLLYILLILCVLPLELYAQRVRLKIESPEFSIGGDLSGANRSIGNLDNFNFSIKTNNEVRLHINANGDVGIGTTTPTTRLDCVGQVKITGGNPGVGKVLTSDADGLASWILPGGGFTDDGAVVRLTTITDKVGIGTATPSSSLEVVGPAAGTVGGFTSGVVHIRGNGTAQFSSSVITGHSSFNGNTQLWYLGSLSSSDDNIAFINRQPGNIEFFTNNISRLTINSVGNITTGQLTGTRLQAGNLRLDGNVFSSENVNGTIIIAPNSTGALILLTDRVLLQGTSIGSTGDNSELMEMRDNRVTTGSAPNYILSINRQNSPTTVLFLGNDANNDAVLVTNNNNLRIGNDIAGVFTERMRIEPAGNVGIGTTTPDTKLHVEDGGTAGAVTPFVGTIATFESLGAGYLSILTPDAFTRGILFGEPSSNLAGGIFYNDPGSPDGFQFRVNGNVTKMVIESDGAVGIGTTNPDFTALLDLSSTTKGFLPPRMTTAQRNAISSPLAGLRIHNTTIDKAEVFTGTSWKTVLTEDIGNVIVQETFASSNVRFFGELALPAAQGWTDIVTGIATIDLVTQTVFGEVKQVVRHNDDTAGGATTSDIVLTAQNWVDINAFGASYGGTDRLDTVNGASGFFSGLQANAAENPLATGNRRYGLQFNNNGGNLRLIESDNTGNTVTMDGTNGNPLITFDEWFSWECVIPAGLGGAEFYINGILTTFIPVFGVNGGGLGTTIKVGSGSTGGSNRIVYHDNFGVTIYEEAATKTLAAATMVGDVAQVNIPEGKRDYTIILPDGNPRAIGSVLRLVANNLSGSVELQNENPAAPEILYNGLRTLVINIVVKETIEGINTVNLGNVYIGFEIATLHVGGSFIDTTDQTIVTVNIPQSIVFSTNKITDGISHVAESDSFTINKAGVYKFEIAPQVGQGAGSSTIEVWIKKNNIDIADSGIQETLSANSEALPILIWTERFVVNEGFKIIWTSNSVNTKLDNLTSLFGGPNIPSIMFHVAHVGN